MSNRVDHGTWSHGHWDIHCAACKQMLLEFLRQVIEEYGRR